MANRLLLALALCLLATGCSSSHDGDELTAASNTGTFLALQANLIIPKCVGCHGSSAPSGNVDLSSHDALVRSGVVMPGDPTNSSFLSSMTSGRMPPGDPVAESLINDARLWILKGAKNDGVIQLISLTPSVGGAGVNTLVTIRGQGFLPGAKVLFGSTPATGVNVVSSNIITAVSPSKGSGADTVQVRNPDGTSARLLDAFVYGAGPSSTGLIVNAVAPSSGNGGTQVLISGFGFVAGATVTVGGRSCAAVQVTSPNQIFCTVPSRSTSGAVDVVVALPSNEASVFANGFTHTVEASYTSLSKNVFIPKCSGCHGAPPNQGIDVRTWKSLTQTGTLIPRDPTNSILIQAILNATMPKAGSTVPAVTTDEKQMLVNWDLNGLPDDTPPSITSMSPDRGSTSGGTVLTIEGTLFTANAQISVGGGACTPVSLLKTDGTQLRCITSAGVPGLTDVMVTIPPAAGVPLRVSTGGLMKYRYIPPPQLVDVDPDSAATSSQANITLTGKNFLPPVAVKFGNFQATMVTQPTANCGESCTAVAKLPPQANAVVTVRLTNDDGQFSELMNGFAYSNGTAPILDSLTIQQTTPVKNLDASTPYVYTNVQYLITAHGRQVLTNAQLSVNNNLVNNASTPDLSNPNDQKVTINFNNGNANSKVPILIVNPDNLKSAAINLEVRQDVSVTSVEPNKGTANLLLTLTGAGFIPTHTPQTALSVKIDQSDCAETPQINTDKTLICRAPAHAAGPVNVTVSYTDDHGDVRTSTAKNAFTYQ